MCQIIYEKNSCGHLGSKEIGQRCAFALRINATDYRQCSYPDLASWPVNVPWLCRNCQVQLTELELQKLHFEKIRDARYRARTLKWSGDESMNDSPLMVKQMRQKIDEIRRRKAREEAGKAWESEEEDVFAGARPRSGSVVHSHPDSQYVYQSLAQPESISSRYKTQQQRQGLCWKGWHKKNNHDWSSTDTAIHF
jgi:hypothetical protein